jgi:hypothetical protein
MWIEVSKKNTARFKENKMSNLKQKGLRVLYGLLAICLVAMIVNVVHFADQWNFKLQAPFIKQEMILMTPKNQTIVNVAQAAPIPVDLDTNDTYICKIFGSQCREALEVQHLEDGNEQCDRLHINKGEDSFDVGLLMVDSVHIGQTIDGHTITLAELTDCKANVDDAYLIYKHSGWGAWSTWKLIPTNLK